MLKTLLAILLLACLGPVHAQLQRLPGNGIPVNKPDAQGVTRTWSKLSSKELVAALQRGGYILMFRHGRTDYSTQDVLPQKTFDDRSTQRHLSEAGREQAKEIGGVLRTLGIRFDRVISSPYFRTREFAELVTGRAPEVDVRMIGGTPQGLDLHRELLGRRPEAGTNTFLSGHQFGVVDLGIVRLHELEEGSCLVFAPGGAPGKYELIAHLNSSDVKALAGAK
jgi:phosphohistidine phosphatase SixA